jgi:hypothetical protein
MSDKPETNAQNEEKMNIEIKSGNETITISEHIDCIAIVYRKWNLYTKKSTTTPLFISSEAFADMVRPLVEVAQYVSANKEGAK